MKVVLTAIGTTGDVLPFIGLGRALVARGHEVTLITHGHFAVQSLRAGLRFVPLGTERQYLDALVRDPLIWDANQGYPQVVRCAMGLVPELYSTLRDVLASGPAVIVAHYLDFASRLIEAEDQAPVLSALVTPFAFQLAREYLADADLPPALAEIRDDGLPNWNMSSLMTIGMFPEWFASQAEAWPERVQLTGFALFDELAPMSPLVNDFLAGGPPPSVFVAGPRVELGVGIDRAAWIDATIQACAILGRRGLILGDLPGISERLPSSMAVAPYAPLTRVVHRCEGLVHHGGIGTIAAALAAGLPQLALPVCHDQPHNAARLRELGVGDWLPGSEVTGLRVAEAFGQLLDSKSVRQRCEHFKPMVRAGDPLGSACAVIEFLAPRSLMPRPSATVPLLDRVALAATGCG